MLTIKDDLFNKVLNPVGIMYYYNIITNNYEMVNTIPQKYDLIVPKAVQEILGMDSNAILTYLVNGRPSKHHDVTDSNRDRFKHCLKSVNSRYYKMMSDHINNIVWVNAAIDSYRDNNSFPFNSICKNNIDRFSDDNRELVDISCQRILSNLAVILKELFPEVNSDNRISSEMKSFISDNIVAYPKLVLEILFFLSLFCDSDDDADFFSDFESHYIKNNYTFDTTMTRNANIEQYLFMEFLMLKKRAECNGIANDAFEITYRDNQLCASVMLKTL